MVAAAAGVLGCAALALWRFGADTRRAQRIGAWAPSDPTLIVLGLAGLAIAYHLLADAFAWNTLRAPTPIVIGVATVAVAASMLLDAVDARAKAREREDQTENDASDAP